MAQPNAVTENELEWIQMKKDLDAQHMETTREKMARKLNQNPLVPIGELYLIAYCNKCHISFSQICMYV